MSPISVVLVNPPTNLHDEAGQFRAVYNFIPPLGIAYLAAALRDRGHQVALYDCLIDNRPPAQIASDIAAYSPDIVGISATTFSVPGAIDLLAELRTRVPKALMLLGGAHISAVPERAMQEVAVDVGIVGEGEWTICELADAVASGERDFSEISGLILRDGDGGTVRTADRPYEKDIDRFPPPARDLLPPLSQYRPTPASYRKLPMAHVFSTRGCPYHCVFCDSSIFGNTYRKHSVERMTEEIRKLVKEDGAREIRFFDDIYTLDKNRVRAIGEAMRREVGKIPWTCMTRVDLVDRELLMDMKRLGCWQVLFGLESGSNDRLDFYKKGVHFEQAEAAVRWAKEAKLRIRGDFIIGLPGETRENMRSCLDNAKRWGLDMAHFNIYIPYPGTPMANQLEAQGLIRHRDYRLYGGEGKSTKDGEWGLPYVPEGFEEAEFIAEAEKIFHAFYRRPSYILQQLLGTRSLYDLKRYWAGFRTFFLSS